MSRQPLYDRNEIQRSKPKIRSKSRQKNKTIMNIQETVPGIGTSAGPGFCVLGGIPYLAWKGEGTDQGLYWSKANSLSPGSNGQYTWAPQTNVPNTASSDGPAIASFGGSLYMAWKGEGNDIALYFSKFVQGAWTPQVKLIMESTNAPALVGTAKGLFMAWKGARDNSIWWSKSTDGATWSAQQTIVFGKASALTSSTPALAASGSNVYLAWKGGSDNSLWWSKCADGATWSTQQKITYGTSTGPALACDSTGTVWLAWKGVNKENIYYSSLTNETKNQWTPQVVRYGVGTSDRPALIAAGNGSEGVMMAWKGENTDPGMYYGTLILSVVSSLTFVLPNDNVGQGSPSSFNINAQLVMNQNGTCTFSGTFNNEAILDESWSCVFGFKDGAGHAIAFTASGETTGSQNWNQTATNLTVAQNWAGIVINNPYLTGSSTGNSFYYDVSDSDDIGALIGGMLEDFALAPIDLIIAIGKAIAGSGSAEEYPSE
jgi:hypothetical protein